jgi:CubicO group peptidase (beta-lactamase class C family)
MTSPVPGTEFQLSRARIPRGRLIALAVSFMLALTVPRSGRAQEGAFQSAFDAYVQSDGVVGASYVVLDRGQITTAHNVGMADRDRNQPVDANTVFHWASITKTLTAVSIMQLRDRGRLSLGDPIVKYVPELRRVHSENGDIERVTLRHLLSHTSGFQGPTWPYRDDSKPWQPFEPTEWFQLVAMMPYQELSFAPGTRFQYSNPGFIYLARVIEALTGDPYQAYVQKNILTPLGMTRSYFNVSPYNLAKDRSNNYTIHADATGGQAVPNGREFDTGITTPNGGLNAPLADLARWVAFLAGPEAPPDAAAILARGSLEEMWKPIAPVNTDAATKSFMGLSFFLYPRGNGADAVTFVGHTGHQAAFRSFMVFNPKNGRAVIAAFNTVHDDDSQTPAAEAALRRSNDGFNDLIARALEILL